MTSYLKVGKTKALCYCRKAVMILIAATTVGSLTSCQKSRDAVPAASTNSPPVSVRSQTKATSPNSAGSTSVGDATVAYFLPADSADLSLGQQFRQFVAAVQDKREAPCMTADGFSPPPAAPLAPPISNQEFPDLTTIRQQGNFGDLQGIQSPPDPTQGMSPAEAKSYQTDLLKCSVQAGAPLKPVKDAGRALATEWQQILSQIDASPDVQAAFATFVQCSSQRGVPIKDLQGFFVYVDQEVVPLIQSGQEQKAAATERQLSDVFVSCFSPAEALRETHRAKQKATFLDAHALAIRQLLSMANSVVSELGVQYGVAFGSSHS